MSRHTFALLVLFALLIPVSAQAQPCTGLCLQQTTCPNGGTTSIIGKVFAPNGTDPLPNVLVYVPNAPLQPFSNNVTCDVAGPLASGSPLVETTSGVDGLFRIDNMPVGANIPLVIQAGRWRRQITVSNVPACATTQVNPSLTRFPRNKNEGDIPRIAVVTGSIDAVECVLRKVGIQDSEFGNPGSSARIHLYQGLTSDGQDINTSTPFENQLWASQATLNQYAMTMLACQTNDHTITPSQQNAFNNYLNAGGRVFATHYEYSWLHNNPQFINTAHWNVNQAALPDQFATVNTSFPKGQQLKTWLQYAGATNSSGQIVLNDIRRDQDGVIAPTQSWLSVNDSYYGPTSVQMTFNTPTGVPADQQCGRVLFAEYHVEPAASADLHFPQACTAGPMTPQEKLLEFALFDLSTFVAPDVPATVSVGFANDAPYFTQGDAAHTITIDVTNTSATIDTDHTLTLTAAIPNGLSVVSMAGANAGTGWICQASTASCTRTIGLAKAKSDPIALVVSVAPDAPVGSGPIVLSATASGGGLANNVVASDPIPIIGLARLTWADPAPFVYGTALDGTQLNATASTDGTFDYQPPAGTVLGAGTHTLSVTFNPDDSENYAPVSATVTLLVDKAPTSVTWDTPASIVYGTALGGAQLNASGSVPGSFTYSPGAGSVLAAGSHVLTATFAPDDSANYDGADATVTLVVDKATPSLTWDTPASIVYGTALGGGQLNASTGVAGSFAYSPDTGAVLGAGSHALMVTFTPDDSANYNGADATVTLVVDKATPSLTWGTPSSIVYGTALGGGQLNASTGVAGSFAYSPDAGSVLGAGSHALMVTFTPDDSANYNGAGATVTLVVDKATPTVSWDNPASIQYGTALSSTQLNASASVAGSFVYTPASGAVLNIGSHTLHAAFTPSDAANYNPASADVTITVVALPAQISGMPGISCSIWPPNNKLVQVATISAANAASFSVSATANEPVPAGDIVIGGTGLQPRTVQLRGSRNGSGTGRVYTITATATNLAGIVTTQTAMCTVPHDSRK